MQKPRIEISKPRRFGLLGVLGGHAVTFLLGIPLLIALAIVSTKNLGWFNLLIPLAALVAVIYLLPWLGNAYIGRLVAPLHDSSLGPEALVVQITFTPRIRRDFRAFIEDADDVGYLAFTDDALIFIGDSVRMTIPFERIKAVHGENVGLRGLYVAAGRVTVEVSGLDNVEAVEIAERSSRVLTTSRRTTRELFSKLKTKVQ